MLVPDVEELEQGEPEEVAVENARRKAERSSRAAGALVLGVDTVVWLDGRMYGKPATGPRRAGRSARCPAARHW